LTNIKIEVTELLKEAPERMGNNSNTSTSKTKKIIATRKNQQKTNRRQTEDRRKTSKRPQEDLQKTNRRLIDDLQKTNR